MLSCLKTADGQRRPFVARFRIDVPVESAAQRRWNLIRTMINTRINERTRHTPRLVLNANRVPFPSGWGEGIEFLPGYEWCCMPMSQLFGYEPIPGGNIVYINVDKMLATIKHPGEPVSVWL